MAKITEKALLDNLDNICNGGDLISKIENKSIYWGYRKIEEGRPAAKTTVEKREVITLENDRTGTIPISSKNDNHPGLAKITQLENELWGNEI